MGNDAIRWGIVGCGEVTEAKSGPGFQKAEGSALVAVMRRNGGLAEDYARRHGVPKWYDDADALIRDPGVDAVYVATPPSSHLRYVLAAARAGKPVYVEKPMGMDHAECLEMIAACEAAGVPLFVAYYRRALPRFLKVKALIEEGRIGAVRAVDVRYTRPAIEKDRQGVKHWRVDPKVSGGGYFHDLGSHMIDLLLFLLGPIRSAGGRSANQGRLYDADDAASAVFEFESGALGTGLWNFCADDVSDRAEILGSEGTISYSTFGEAPVLLRRGGAVEAFDIPNPPHVQQPLIQTVVDELRGKGRCISTGRTGALTNRAMDLILGAP